MNIKRDMEFLFEVGSMRYLERTWKRFLGADFANVAEHSFRVAWIAMVLAKHEKAKDIQKVTLIALLHDIGESRTGDVNYLYRCYTKRDEKKAFRDIFEKTSLSGDIKNIIKEYEDRKSLESKIVKDADILDVELELAEQRSKGNSIGTIWLNERDKNFRTQLHTKSARKFWDEIRKVNPHDWHLKGRNMFNDKENYYDNSEI
jgi:putative hydrolase of HD superfamily